MKVRRNSKQYHAIIAGAFDIRQDVGGGRGPVESIETFGDDPFLLTRELGSWVLRAKRGNKVIRKYVFQSTIDNA